MKMIHTTTFLHLPVEEGTTITCLMMSEKWSKGSIAALASMSVEEKLELADKKRTTWHSPNNKDTLDNHSRRTSQRRLEEEKNKSAEEKKEFSETMREAYWGRSEKEIADHHMKQSLGVSAWHATKSDELEKQRIENMRSTKKKLKLKYVHTVLPYQLKQVPEKDLAVWLAEGWLLGMGPKSLRLPTT
jgi:hypothetical protein